MGSQMEEEALVQTELNRTTLGLGLTDTVSHGDQGAEGGNP